MALTIPNFNTTASITGNTLISQADEQLNIFINDVKTYVQNTFNLVSSTLEGESASILAQMQALYDTFGDIFLGSKATNPSTDNDGNALVKGTMYFNSTSSDLRIYNGSIWITITALDAYTRNEVKTVLPAVGLDTTLNDTPTQIGQMTWNQDESTINVRLPFDIVGQMFQEYFIPVKNQTGHTILNGRPVMAIGTTGNSGKVLIEYHNGLQSKARNLVGFTTSDILNGDDSLITVSGKVRGINTTGSAFGETWNDGDILYVKPNTYGMLTKVEPSDTELKIPIAFVVHAHTSGTLLVRTTPIDENLHKSWTQSKLDLKANVSDVFTQGQINTLLAAIELRLESLEAILL